MFVSLNIPKMTQRVRQLSDIRGSQFQTDAEIQDLLEDSFDQLYMSIAELDENYFLKQAENQVATDDVIVFPSDFYKIKLLERGNGGDYYHPIYQKTLAELSGIESPYFDWSYSEAVPYGFALFPDHLKLYPSGSGDGYKFRLSYIRDPMAISSASLQKSWEKALIYKTAYTITAIQDNPRVSLGDLAKEYQDNIMNWASNRNRGPRVIQDLERHQGYFFGGY